MQLKLVDNSIVNFSNFYAYNYMNGTNINSDNTLVFTDSQFGSSEKMFMTYPSKLFVVSLYHHKETVNKKDKKYVASFSYLPIEGFEKLKKISLNKIDYLVIAERKECIESAVATFVTNILFLTNKSGTTSYNISKTEVKVTYSSIDFKNKNSERVEFSFIKEVLGKPIDYNDDDTTTNLSTNITEISIPTKKEDKPVDIPCKWILCNNDFFYNLLSLVIAGSCIIGLYPDFLNGYRNTYPVMVASVIIALVFISVLQYIRIDNNKKSKKNKKD